MKKFIIFFFELVLLIIMEINVKIKIKFCVLLMNINNRVSINIKVIIARNLIQIIMFQLMMVILLATLFQKMKISK